MHKPLLKLIIHFIVMYLIIIENYVDGNGFLQLKESDIKEIVPPIGLAKNIIRLNPKVC